MKTSTRLFSAVMAFLLLSVALFGAAFYTAALSSTATLVSAKPRQLTGYNIANPNAATVYVQVFDAAATNAVTVGTTSPTFVLAVPGNGVLDGPQLGAVSFASGIVVAATTTATGSTAPSTALSCTLFTQ